MVGFRGKIEVVMWALLISLLVRSTIENGGERDIEKSDQHRPNAVERAIGMTDHMSSWDRIKSWIRITGTNLSPPVHEPEKAHAGAGEVIREAATMSFEKSKETAQKSAKAAGAVVQRTMEKVKRTVSNSGEKMEERDL